MPIILIVIASLIVSKLIHYILKHLWLMYRAIFMSQNVKFIKLF